MTQAKAWWEKSRPIDDLHIDICFLLSETFYIGNPNDHLQLENPRFFIPLDMPTFPRVVRQLARSEEIVGHEEALANYYLQIARLAKTHQQDFNTIRDYFWLRLWLWNTNQDVHISFPRYDSLKEFSRFFAALQQEKAGEVYCDMDQGWELNVRQSEDLLYFQQRDPDEDSELINVNIARSLVVKQLGGVQQRSQKIIAYLSEKMGVDVWSEYIREDVAFKL